MMTGQIGRHHLSAPTSGDAQLRQRWHTSDIGKQHGEWVAKVLHVLLKPFFRSPLKGAETSLYLCSSNDVAEISGAYFNNCKVERPKPWAEDDTAAEKLWNCSEQCVGFAYPVSSS